VPTVDPSAKLDPDEAQRCCARIRHEVARLTEEYQQRRQELLLQYQELQRRCPHLDVTEHDDSTPHVILRYRRCTACGSECHRGRWFAIVSWT